MNTSATQQVENQDGWKKEYFVMLFEFAAMFARYIAYGKTLKAGWDKIRGLPEVITSGDFRLDVLNNDVELNRLCTEMIEFYDVFKLQHPQHAAEGLDIVMNLVPLAAHVDKAELAATIRGDFSTAAAA